ncbi:MAG: phosphatase PAP2 family protein [Chloroflexota bacterium]|nr:MAG: phosphatase PAP2 family protein [Chloroflexota bacterium]
MNPIYESGIKFIQTLQTLSPSLDSLMEIISFLGTIQFYLILIPFIYWVIDARLGFRVLLVLIGTDFLGVAFKQLLHQPRPYWIGDVQVLAEETSYGIPSTHASDSFAVWGYLAYRVNKTWLWVVTLLVVLLVGFSRMYLGVHFPTDVLGGWLLGLLGIFLVAKGEGWLSPKLKKQSVGALIGIGFFASMLMLLAGWLIGLLIASSLDPAEWAQYATQARGISHYFTLAGATFGMASGYSLMRKFAPFQTKGSWAKRIGRYLLGIVGVLVIYFGLDLLFGMVAADESVLGLALRYVRLATVTFWATFGAPWVFLKIRLAEPAKS